MFSYSKFYTENVWESIIAFKIMQLIIEYFLQKKFSKYILEKLKTIYNIKN